jgi:hypothetical protein
MAIAAAAGFALKTSKKLSSEHMTFDEIFKKILNA